MTILMGCSCKMYWTHLPICPWQPDALRRHDAAVAVPKSREFFVAAHEEHGPQQLLPLHSGTNADMCTKRWHCHMWSWLYLWPVYRRPDHVRFVVLWRPHRDFYNCWCDYCCCYCYWSQKVSKAGVICWKANSRWTRSAFVPTAEIHWKWNSKKNFILHWR